jgi:hypothetical protein
MTSRTHAALIDAGLLEGMILSLSPLRLTAWHAL